MPHTEEKPCYLQIAEKLTMKEGRLNEKRWKFLNTMIESEPKIESLQVTPITPTATSTLSISSSSKASKKA